MKQSLLPTDFWRCCPWFFRKGLSAVTGPLREAQECAHVGPGAAQPAAKAEAEKALDGAENKQE